MILPTANLKLARVHSNAECSIANHAAYLTKFGQNLIQPKIQKGHHKLWQSLKLIMTRVVKTERKSRATITSVWNMSMMAFWKLNAGMKPMKASNVKVKSILVGKIRSKILFSEKFQDWCLYDKNGAACCTKKLDLVNGWLDTGYLDDSPFVNYIKLFDKKTDYWDLIKTRKWVTQASTIYHVDGVDKENDYLNIKTRWNFECPTHHPVPTVAIILGNSRNSHVNRLSSKFELCLFCIINDAARDIFSTIVRMFHSGHDYTAWNRDFSVFPCKNSPASKRRGGSRR